jgi:hypothetical protein
MGIAKNVFVFFAWSLLLAHTSPGLSQSIQTQSRPYLVTNQSKYIPGDTVWFKIYLLNEALNKVSGKYRIHIDWVDGQGNSKLHSFVAVTDGIGQNQLALPESIESGIYLLTAYLDGQASDEPFFLFKKEIPVVSQEFQFSQKAMDNRTRAGSAIDVNVELPSQDFHPREKASMQISLKDDHGLPVEGEFSVSVVNKELFSNQQSEDFDNELISLFNESYPKAQTLIKSTSNQQKLAQVFFSNSGQSLPDSTNVFFYLQKSRWRYQTLVGKNGWVKLSLPDLNFQDEFFYLAEIDDHVTEHIQVKWDEKSITFPKARLPERKEGLDNYALYSSKKRIIDQSFDFYERIDAKVTGRNEEKGRPDILPVSVAIDTRDYDLFPTMQEYIKEIIPALYYRRRGGKDVVRVKLQSPGSNRPPASALNDPIYIIDGVVTQNTDFFLLLKPVDILTIKIANDPRKLAPWGLFGKNGVLIVQTKRGNTRELLVDKTRVFEGLSPAIPFTIKMYHEGSDLRVPDFRANLYWNPTVVTGENGKAAIDFFCSDDIGEFEIIIRGITSNGHPFSASRKFGVKP